MLLLEQKTIRKERVDKNMMKLDAGNKSEEYKVEAIYNNTIYAKESASDLIGLYYLVFEKVIQKKKISKSLI